MRLPWRKDYDAAEAMYKRALELDPSNAINTSNYASFLADQRKDYEAADALYKRALELDPNDANTAANFASCLLARNGRAGIDRAGASVRRVIELAAGVPSQALAEALLYDCLISDLASGSAGRSIGRLKALLGQSYERGSWDFSPVFDACLPDIAEERRDFYRALGEAILDAEKVGEMDRFPLWRETPPTDPFSLSE